VITRSTRRRQRGQALVEMGMVVTLFVTLSMGLIEFGRAWMIGNMVTHAARDGARAGAVASNRGTGGTLTNAPAIQTQVLNQISNVTPTAGLTVNVTQPTISGIPVVQVQVTGSIPYLFNLVGTSFNVNRTATFRDEGR
jgi:Flp pilus assembly protein TadG